MDFTKVRLLAVDSDGCVIDSMTVKHERCFTPALIKIWQLKPVAALATELALDINLYSESRGLNRFAALALFFDRLMQRLPQVPDGVELPDTRPLKDWLASTRALSEEALIAANKQYPAAIFEQAIAWSREVNRRVQALPLPKAFDEAVATLREAHRRGIAIHVVSSANRAALELEWRELGLMDWVAHLGSQDEGSKTVLLQQAARSVGAESVLMVGDAKGDAEAATAAGVGYFAIRPGAENQSWLQLRNLLINFPNK